MKRSDYAETAAILRRLLEAVDRGELTAATPQALALMRRMEGAAAAFEVLGGPSAFAHLEAKEVLDAKPSYRVK